MVTEPTRFGDDWLAERFEAHRGELTGVAYRLLGSRTEADDAVQEAWLRLSRVDPEAIDNLVAWLTTVVARISLNMLQARSRRDEPLDTIEPPATVAASDDAEPEPEALLADSVGLALLVVLDTLTPAERLAFVLHDMFGLSFDEIAAILERSPDAARQLASRGRRRVRGAAPPTDSDPAAEREVVEAFLAAARDGDFAALLRVLDPNVVLRHATGPGHVTEVRGAELVLQRAQAYASLGLTARRALINGAQGWLGFRDGELFSASEMTVRDGRITAMTFITDTHQLEELEIAFLEDELL